MTDVVRTFRSVMTGRPKGLHYLLAFVVAASLSIAAAGPTLVDAAEQGNHAAAIPNYGRGGCKQSVCFDRRESHARKTLEGAAKKTTRVPPLQFRYFDFLPVFTLQN